MKTHFRHPTAVSLSGLAVLCVFLLMFGLGSLPFLGPDEPRYAEVAREMFTSGDWITPRLAGITWFEKPALLYWLAVLGYRALGVSELSARLGVALMASAAVFGLFLLGQRTRSALVGYLAAASLVSMGVWVGFARGATFDMPLAVAIEFALLSFWWWNERAGDHNLGWYACCLGVGLAVLAKGLVGIVLPGAIIASFLILTRQLRVLLRHRRLLVLGATVFLATSATWYGPMFATHGRDFVNEFFVAHHFRRYLSDSYRHPQPFYFFFFVALAGCFPWTAYLVAAAARDARRLRELVVNEELHLRLFLWLWILVPLVFFSFSGSKLPGYILPVFPAVGLMIGLELTASGKGAVWATATTSLLLVTASIAIGLQGESQLGVTRSAAWTIASLGIATGLSYLGIRLWLSERAAAVFLPFALAGIVVATVALFFPALARRESIRDLAAVAQAVATQNERLVFYLDANQGVNYYATSLPLRDARSELVTLGHGDQIASLLKDQARESLLVMCYERWSHGLLINERLRSVVLATHPRPISCSPGCDWVLLRVSLEREGRDISTGR